MKQSQTHSFCLFILFMFPQAFADPQESVDVSSVQEKYWNQGEENEIGVVQNRKYSSDHKFELGTFTGTISSDPFLDVHPYGLSLGYHFDSIWSVHVRGWKNSVGPSDALIAFQQKTGATVDTNNPKSFWGAEINANILYGKLSLLGAMIIYNDLFMIGGAGMTQTETGNEFTPLVGIGEKIHLNAYLCLHLDYRIMQYHEQINSKNPSTLGQPVGSRTNTSDAVLLGLDFSY